MGVSRIELLGLWIAELAEQTGVREQYVWEWLVAQAASGYVAYDLDPETFTLAPEHALAFAPRRQRSARPCGEVCGEVPHLFRRISAF